MVDNPADIFDRPDRAFRRAAWIEQRMNEGASQSEIAEELRFEAEKWDIQRDFSKASVSAHHAAWRAIVRAGLEPDAELFAVAFRVTSTGNTAEQRDQVVGGARRLPEQGRRAAFLDGMSKVANRPARPSSGNPIDRVLTAIADLRGGSVSEEDVRRILEALIALRLSRS